MAKPKTTTKPKARKPAPRRGRKTGAKAKDGTNRGARLTLNEAKLKAIAGALEDGHYAETACALAGVGVSSFYRWMETGEADAEADVKSIQRDLWEAVEKARAVAEDRALAVIREAATTPIYGAAGNVTSTGQWQAAAWYLERTKPERYGRREKHEHSGSVTLTQLEALVDQGSE